MNSGEDSAFPIGSSSSSASHEYDGSVSMSTDSFLENRCKSLSVVEVVELVGLITCERVVYRHRAILLIQRVRSGFSTRRFRPRGG